MKYVIAYIVVGVLTASSLQQIYKSAGWESRTPIIYVSAAVLWPALQLAWLKHSLADESFLDMSVQQ